MRNFRIAAAVGLVLTVAVAGCGGGASVSTFRIKNVDYRIIGPVTSAAVKPQLQEALVGRFWVTYEKGPDVTKVVFEHKMGQPDFPRPWITAGEDPDLDGRFEFDSSELGMNWITIRGTAVTKDDAKQIVDQRTVLVDNVPPSVSVTPRRNSVLNAPPGAIVITLMDGSGINLAKTDVELHANGGPSFERSESQWEYGGNSLAEIRLIPSFWSEGDYEVVITPEDSKGNRGTLGSYHDSAIFRFALDRSIAGSPPSITLTGPPSGGEVQGIMELLYTCSPDVVEVRYDRGYVPYYFGPSDEKSIVWFEGEEDPSIDGRFEVDTRFTRQNWVAFRLFARSSNGLTATSNMLYYRVNNL